MWKQERQNLRGPAFPPQLRKEALRRQRDKNYHAFFVFGEAGEIN